MTMLLRAPSPSTATTPLTPRQIDRGPLVWALDPNIVDLAHMRKMLKVVKAWRTESEKVIPISVLSPLDIGWPIEFPDAMSDKFYRVLSSRLQSRLSMLKADFIEPTRLIQETGLTLRSAVEEVLRSAEQLDAQMVVVNSKSSPKSRWSVLGSFAEYMISLSPVPVMVLGDKAEPSSEISKIFFPTDFSPASQKAFRSTLGWARDLKAEVILYHQADLSEIPMAYVGVGLPLDPRWLSEAQESRQDFVRSRAERWIRNANKQGIECEFVLDTNVGELSDRILKLSKAHKANLLSVGVSRGPYSQVFLGGTVRKLFSESTIPVMAVHAKA